MAINMKSLTQALAKTAAAIEKTVQTTVQEVTGPKALQDYDLLEQVASGGPALAWKLFSARPRNKNSLSQYSQVCVWYLDKKTLSDARQKAGLSKSAEDAFLDILRADAARLVRLRHPGVVHVVQGLDESKVAMALVTEPIFSSLANAMGDLSNISEVPKDLKAIDMSELEIKHGLLQLSESLAFLHNNARLVHRAISPETVFITATGAWKLGCFGFAISANQATDAETIQPFHYPEYDVEDSVVPLQPSLNYTAPELVRSNPSSISYACDIFSLGCLIYHLLTKRPLLDCHNNARMFMSKVQYLSHENFSDISPDLIPNLREMLSPNETSRPSALDFTGSSYFRDDTRLRALRFLDHMLEIDNMKKSEFLKALAGMWKDFDARVLRYKNTWEKYGCSIMADGWTTSRGRTLINFLVASKKGTVFIKSVDASDHVKRSDYLLKLFEETVNFVGEKNVVQFITDNASNYVKAGEELMKRHPSIYWTPCAAHCLDLLLEDLSKIDHITEAINGAKQIGIFVYNHGIILSLVRKYTEGKDIVRPATTRFATHFLTLKSLESKCLQLMQAFASESWLHGEDFLQYRTSDGRETSELVYNNAFWEKVSASVKVLPPLCAELRNVVIQQMILPMVLTIAESQDKNDFEISTLPALVPVFSSATGDTLLLLVKHAELIINKADQEQLVAHILPLLVRAYDDPDVRIQEEVLKRTVALAKQLDFQVMKQSVLPRVHGLALKTTVAAVRVNALMCLGELVHWLDKRAVLDILQTLQRCTAVDHSAPTLMSTLGVAQAIYKQYGLEFAVEHLLPLLAPLLVAQQLNLQQFAKYMLFVKEILRKVEEKRGVTLSEMGSSRDISSNIIGVNSSYMESMKSVSFAGNKHSNSWDSEDWGKLAKSSNSSASLNHSSPDAKFSLKSALKDSLKTVSVQPDTASKNESWYLDDWVSTAKDSKSVAGVSHSSLDGRVAFNNMMKEPQNSSMQMMEHSVGPNLLTSQASISITCAPADTLWPTPSTVTSVLSTSESTASFSEYGSWSTSTDGGLPGTGKMKSKLNNPTASVGSMSSIDVIDPFADWPPRANANSAVNQTRQIPSSGHVVRAENTPIQNASSVDMASNLGLQFSQSAAPENHNPIDIGTIFPSTKTDPVPLKIAPPPSGGSKGIGRGRGRARTSVQARSNSSNEGNSKTHGSQPPLLDLL